MVEITDNETYFCKCWRKLVSVFPSQSANLNCLCVTSNTRYSVDLYDMATYFITIYISLYLVF